MVEHQYHTLGVAGSRPAARTTFPKENGSSSIPDTVSTHETPENGDADMSKWPKKVKHRNKVLAKIYGLIAYAGDKKKRKKAAYPGYRVVWTAGGRRMMKAFPTYSGPGGAKEYAEALVPELAKHSQAVMLTPPQATDALAALERLNTFQQTTGRKVSLLAAVSDYCEAAAKLRGRMLGEAVEGFNRTVATVERKDLSAAVEEFIAAEEPRTRAGNGQRAQLSAKYHYNRAIQLRRFAGTFSGYAVCDLGKQDLDTFISSKAIADFSPKSRNHHRTAIAQFIAWAVRKDYLPAGHRLNEADGMRQEHANTAEVQCYTAKEFRTLLETADGPMRAMIALGGLAGLRTAEVLRLDWADVWRVRGHVEITAGKAKNRQRRLVQIVPALAAWLQPFRQFTTGPVWTDTESVFVKASRDLWEKAAVARKANGLRHAFCSFAYVLHGEDWTAQQAGNSPAMVHSNYKNLATKKEAQAWFAVKPAGTAQNIIALPLKGAAA